MKTFARLAVVALLGLAAFGVSSRLVARHVAPRGSESAGVVPLGDAIARHAAPGAVPARHGARKAAMDEVVFDGSNLVLAGSASLDNTAGPALGLRWVVRVLDDSREDVLFERTYDGQRFALGPDANLAPTFADALVLPERLPRGRYAVELALVDDAGDRVCASGRYVAVK
jgi:hypothetical protein